MKPLRITSACLKPALALAAGLALAALPHSAGAATQSFDTTQVFNSGGSVSVGDDYTITIDGNGADYRALFIDNGTHLTASPEGQWQLNIADVWGIGARVENQSSLTGSNFVINIDNGYGLSVTDASSVALLDTAITIADRGLAVLIYDGTVTLANTAAPGTAGAPQLRVTGDYSTGVNMQNGVSNVFNGTNLDIVATGLEARGIDFAWATGTATLNNTRITVTGPDDYAGYSLSGVYMDGGIGHMEPGLQSVLSATGLEITVTGGGAKGIFSWTNSRPEVSGGQNTSRKVLDLTDTTIRVTGNEAMGINIAYTQLTGTNLQIVARQGETPTVAVGFNMGDDSTLDVKNLRIDTNAFGFAMEDGVATIEGLEIHATHADYAALVFTNNASVDANGGDWQLENGRMADANNRLTVTGGTLEAAGALLGVLGVAWDLENHIVLENVQATGRQLLNAVAYNGARTDITLKNSTASGDLVAGGVFIFSGMPLSGGDAQNTVSLTEGSTLTGGALVDGQATIAVEIDATSRWNVTATDETTGAGAASNATSLTNAGTLAIGAGVSLTVNEELTLLPGAEVLLSLGGSGNEGALLTVEGLATLEGTLRLDVSAAELAVGNAWVLLDFDGGLDGAFDALLIGNTALDLSALMADGGGEATVGGVTYAFDLGALSPGGGMEMTVAITDVQAVPEPGTWAAMLVGGLGVLAWVRRTRRRA